METRCETPHLRRVIKLLKRVTQTQTGPPLTKANTTFLPLQ